MANNSMETLVEEIAKEAVDGKYGFYTPGDMREADTELYQNVFSALAEKVQGNADLTDRWLSTDMPGSEFMDAVADAAVELTSAGPYNDLTAADNEILAEEAKFDSQPQLTTADALLKSATESPGMASSVSQELANMVAGGKPIDGLTSEIAEQMKTAGIDGEVLDKALALSDAHPVTDNPVSAPEDKVGVVVALEYKEGHIVDAILKDPEAQTETRLSDIIGDIKDDATVQRVLEDVGTDVSPQELFDAIQKAVLPPSEVGQGVTVDQTDKDGKGFAVPPSQDVAKSDHNPDVNADVEAKFDKHNEAYTGLMEKPFHSKSNMAICYHDFSRTYNAYKGGIEIDGKVPGIGDVLVSFRNFLNSDPGDALLDALWNKVHEYLVDKENANDVAKDTNRPIELAPPTDKLGVSDNGHVDVKSIDADRAKGIELARDTVSPLVGTQFGADMGKVDKGSDGELSIRTTNPNPDKTDKSMQVRLNDTSRFTFPDARLIEFRGTQALVDPFGRVMFSSDDRFSVGERLPDLDVTKTDRGKEAITCYAEKNGLSVEQARDEISQKVEARFCDRIEAGYKVEAANMDRTDKDGNRVGVIPDAQEKLTTLRGQDAMLGRVEVILGKDNKLSADIQDARSKLQGAIETQAARVDSLYERKNDLETLAGKADDKNIGSLDDRFRIACDSEMRAVGRSAFGPAPMSTDDKAAIDKAITSCEKEISLRVERFNEGKPELDKVSFDSKSGDFVDRFGFTQKGDYVGNQNGPFMAEGVSGPDSMSKEDVDRYKSENFDESRFPDTSVDDWGKDGTEADTETIDIHELDSGDSLASATATTNEDTGADAAVGDDDTPSVDVPEEPADPIAPAETAEHQDAKDGEIEAVDATAAATGDNFATDNDKSREKDVVEGSPDRKDEPDFDMPSDFADALQGLKDLLEENLSPDELSARADGIADKVATGLESIVDPTTGDADSPVIKQFADDFVDIIAEAGGDISEPTSVVIEALGSAVGDGAIGSELMDAISAAGNNPEVPDFISHLLNDSVEIATSVAGTDIPSTAEPVVKNEDIQSGDMLSPVDMGATVEEILNGQPYDFEIEELPDDLDSSATDNASIDASMEDFQNLESGLSALDILPSNDNSDGLNNLPDVDKGIEGELQDGDYAIEEVGWGG